MSFLLPKQLYIPLEQAEIQPMINQIEIHPGMLQRDTVDFCRKHNIVVEAWAPLSNGQMFEVTELKKLAEKYNKSIAQICLNWLLQKDIIPLPKSVTPSRIKENLEIFDFKVTEEDMQIIDSLSYCGGSGLHPDEVDF